MVYVIATIVIVLFFRSELRHLRNRKVAVGNARMDVVLKYMKEHGADR